MPYAAYKIFTIEALAQHTIKHKSTKNKSIWRFKMKVTIELTESEILTALRGLVSVVHGYRMEKPTNEYERKELEDTRKLESKLHKVIDALHYDSIQRNGAAAERRERNIRRAIGEI